VIQNENQHFSKLFDLFPKIIHKGEKILLDSDVISLKSIMPGRISFSSLKKTT